MAKGGGTTKQSTKSSPKGLQGGWSNIIYNIGDFTPKESNQINDFSGEQLPYKQYAYPEVVFINQRGEQETRRPYIAEREDPSYPRLTVFDVYFDKVGAPVATAQNLSSAKELLEDRINRIAKQWKIKK